MRKCIAYLIIIPLTLSAFAQPAVTTRAQPPWRVWKPIGLAGVSAPIVRYYGNMLYAGTANGLYRRQVGAAHAQAPWEQIGLAGVDVDDVYIRPAAPVVTPTIYTLLRNNPNGRAVAWSSDLTNWSYDDGSLVRLSPYFTDALIGNPGDVQTLFALLRGSDGNVHLFRSQNGGTSWQSAFNFGAGHGNALATVASHPDVLWVGGKGRYSRRGSSNPKTEVPR
jgi:hypothetical protein